MINKYLKLNRPVAFILLLCCLHLAALLTACSPQEQKTSAASSLYEVVRVVDGDTIRVLMNGKEEVVRLIGVDTPETKHPNKAVESYGREASDFATKLLTKQKVRLEMDVEPKDRYGRFLAYVYLEDGTFVNALLIKEGYAQVLTVPPNVKHKEEFLRQQQEARKAKKGLWGLEQKKP